MKKILFPITARPHLPRQKLLLDELIKYVEVRLFQPNFIDISDKSFVVLDIAKQFKEELEKEQYDLVLIRADRYELMMLAIISVLKGVPIAHLEAGDLSGVWDNRVRHAISHLSDYHFPTHQEAEERLIRMGLREYNIFQYGSLDVEYAMQVLPKRIIDGKYIVVTYHATKEEDENQLDYALNHFREYEIIKIKGNQDYNKDFGDKEYNPEDYINLLRNAECVVGNSSSIIKELSIMGVGGVLVGDRQRGRLRPDNVIDAKCEKDDIIKAMEWQIGNEYPPDYIYYKENTAENIAKELCKILKI